MYPILSSESYAAKVDKPNCIKLQGYKQLKGNANILDQLPVDLTSVKLLHLQNRESDFRPLTGVYTITTRDVKWYDTMFLKPVEQRPFKVRRIPSKDILVVAVDKDGRNVPPRTRVPVVSRQPRRGRRFTLNIDVESGSAFYTPPKRRVSRQHVDVAMATLYNANGEITVTSLSEHPDSWQPSWPEQEVQSNHCHSVPPESPGSTPSVTMHTPGATAAEVHREPRRKSNYGAKKNTKSGYTLMPPSTESHRASNPEDGNGSPLSNRDHFIGSPYTDEDRLIETDDTQRIKWPAGNQIDPINA